MKHFALALFLASAVPLQPSGVVTDPDAYAVYNAVIPSDSFVRDAHAKELLIQETTRLPDPTGKYCFPSGPDLTGPWAAALANLKQQNAETKTLLRRFTSPMPYRLIPKETLDGFFNAAGIDGWGAFHASYPDARGFLQVSVVGFDETHERAIIHLSHSCGSLCGEGRYHFLVRTANGWSEPRLNINGCFVVS
jgi:hypothetical protein